MDGFLGRITADLNVFACEDDDARGGGNSPPELERSRSPFPFTSLFPCSFAASFCRNKWQLILESVIPFAV